MVFQAPLSDNGDCDFYMHNLPFYLSCNTVNI